MKGRVSAEYKASYEVMVDDTTYEATVRGHFHEHEHTFFPKVGDFVLITIIDQSRVVIEEVLERQNQIVRQAPHTGAKQVMVANVDFLFIVMGLDDDFNVRRLERYIALAEQSQVKPVIILNKKDVTADLDTQLAQVKSTAGEIAVHCVSAKTGEGLFELDQYLTPEQTIVLLGSSGAGKSTLTNHFLQAATQPTRTLRQRDGRGRHTTTSRQLFKLPTGAFLIDTPGLRELALIDDKVAADAVFSDVAALALECRFRNCDHVKSAGCALQAAVAAGELDAATLKTYLALQHNTQRRRRIRGR